MRKSENLKLKLPANLYPNELPRVLWQGEIEGFLHRVVIVPDNRGPQGYDFALEVASGKNAMGEDRWVTPDSSQCEITIFMEVIHSLINVYPEPMPEARDPG